jgi:hypothetical protein
MKKESLSSKRVSNARSHFSFHFLKTNTSNIRRNCMGFWRLLEGKGTAFVSPSKLSMLPMTRMDELLEAAHKERKGPSEL